MSARLRTWFRSVSALSGTAGSVAELTDGELVTAFATTRDEGAFAELVRRHGPMVLATCRRVLYPDAHTADDAFQATFLVLATKAGGVLPPERVGVWLHGVAVHVAKRAKSWVRKLVPSVPSELDKVPAAFAGPDPDAAWLRAAIDDVLAGLPAKYRSPVVLCDLEGKSRAEAAAVLGCSEGTLSGRLARARGLLADRLARRGVAVPAAGLAVVLPAQPAAASVPAHLAASTVKAATLVAAGAAAAEVASGPVAALARGGCESMTTTFRILTAGAVAVSLAIAGWAVASLFEHVSDPPPSGQDAGGATIIDPAAPKAWVTDTFTHEHPVTAVAFGPGVVAAGDNAGVLTLWDVRGGREKETLLGPGNRKVKSIDRVHFSPDGVWLYVVTDDGQSEFQCSVEKKDRYFPAVGGRGQWASYGVTADGAYWLQRISGSNELIVLKNGFGQRVFGGTAAAQFFHSQPIDHVAAGDAQTIVTVSGGVLRRWGLGSATPIWETKLEKIDPAGLAVGPDGKVIAVAGKGGEVQLFSAEAGVRAGKLAGHTGEVCAVAFSGDGKRIATGGADKTARLWDAESFTQLAVLKGHTAAVTAVAFSPAGNRIATGSADRTVKVWEHRMCPWLVADTAE